MNTILIQIGVQIAVKTCISNQSWSEKKWRYERDSQVTSVTGVLIATDYALYGIQTFWGIRVKFVSAMVLDIPVRALYFG